MRKQIAIILQMPDPVAGASGPDMKIAVARELIDKAAGAARARWSAAYPFQAEEYQRAAEQAVAYQADPSSGAFKALQADVDAGTIDPRTGKAVTTLAESAALILFKRDLYNNALDEIRALRLAAKARVKQAKTETEIRDAMKVAWPKP